MKLFIRCGLATYSDTRVSFLFRRSLSFVTIFIPLPHAWFVGFIIHSLLFSAVSRAISNRSKSEGKM